MDTQESRPGSAPGAPEGGTAPPPATDVFDRIRGLGVTRPEQDRWAAGVCAGLARRWGLDPMLVRGLFVVSGVVTVGFAIYGVLWLFLPQDDGRIHAQRVLRGDVTAGSVGAVLFVLVDLPFGNGVWGPGFHPLGGVVTFALIAFCVWWFAARRRRRVLGYLGIRPSGDPWPPGPWTPRWTVAAEGAVAAPPSAALPGPSHPGPSHPGRVAVRAPRARDLQRPLHALTLTTIGVAALAAGGVLLWDRQVHHVRGGAALVAVAAALGAVALGIVVSGALGRRAGGLAPLAILLMVAAVNGVAWHDRLHGFGGDVTWTPASSVPADGYALDAGRAVLDLTGPGAVRTATARSPVTVPVSLGVGELVIVVPAGTTTNVQVSVGLGDIADEVTRPGDHGEDGLKMHREFTYGSGAPAVTVDATVGVGQVRIVPVGTTVSR